MKKQWLSFQISLRFTGFKLATVRKVIYKLLTEQFIIETLHLYGRVIKL